MKMYDIRKIAKQNGLRTGNMGKIPLIKKIQATEGNFDCFATAENDYCDQSECIWLGDCIKLAKKSVSVS